MKSPRIIKGDITEADEEFIIHQVNCMNAMGSGVAKALFTKWADVKHIYHRDCEHNKLVGKSQDNLLGFIGIVPVSTLNGNKYVINAYSQLTYGNDGVQHTDYDAVAKCFILSRNMMDVMEVPKIAIPFGYGCGLGGGDWDIVYGIIKDIFGSKAVLYKI
jgi:O-acetyl-ADP-ribose deacetylase (regulator of RNase III)